MNLKLNDPKFHEKIFNEVGNIVQESYNYLNDEEADELEIIYAIGSIENGWISFDVFFSN